MLAQAIVACGRHAPGRRVVSAHMLFMRAADAREPLSFELDELPRDEPSRRSVCVCGRANGRARRGRSCSTPPRPMRSATARRRRTSWVRTTRCRSTWVSPAASYASSTVRTPTIRTRPSVLRSSTRGCDSERCRPILHCTRRCSRSSQVTCRSRPRCVPTPASDRRRRTTRCRRPSTRSAISFHAEVAADQWMLYHHLSTFAGDGMTHAECRVHDERGALVASFTVDAMVRGFREGTRPQDERTAL